MRQVKLSAFVLEAPHLLCAVAFAITTYGVAKFRAKRVWGTSNGSVVEHASAELHEHSILAVRNHQRQIAIILNDYINAADHSAFAYQVIGYSGVEYRACVLRYEVGYALPQFNSLFDNPLLVGFDFADRSLDTGRIKRVKANRLAHALTPPDTLPLVTLTFVIAITVLPKFGNPRPTRCTM